MNSEICKYFHSYTEECAYLNFELYFFPNAFSFTKKGKFKSGAFWAEQVILFNWNFFPFISLTEKNIVENYLLQH